jgi:hypothetical protein
MLADKIRRYDAYLNNQNDPVLPKSQMKSSILRQNISSAERSISQQQYQSSGDPGNLLLEENPYQQQDQDNRPMPQPLPPLDYSHMRDQIIQLSKTPNEPFLCTTLEALRKRLTIQKSV